MNTPVWITQVWNNLKAFISVNSPHLSQEKNCKDVTASLPDKAPCDFTKQNNENLGKTPIRAAPSTPVAKPTLIPSPNLNNTTASTETKPLLLEDHMSEKSSTHSTPRTVSKD